MKYYTIKKAFLKVSINIRYSKLGENYAKRIHKPNNFTKKQENQQISMYLPPTSIEEVEKSIDRLRDKKSPGYAGIMAETKGRKYQTHLLL